MCKRQCLECAAKLTDRDYRAEFCGAPCRKTWNNRRMQRGAELYDLFMAMRHQRELTQGMALWSLVCRMATVWNMQDQEAGRRTYGDPVKVRERMIAYVATVVKRGRKKGQTASGTVPR